MKICYVTEMNFKGKIPRDYPMMRTEQAWPCTLEADCVKYNIIPEDKYDLALVVIPKSNIDVWMANDTFDKIRSYADKVAIMQEGPHWCFQDFKLNEQIWYYNTLRAADILFVHNEVDLSYYRGITGHSDIRILPTLMIEDSIKNLPRVERKGVMIGGNFVSWYGGFDSFIIASEVEEPIYSPLMGRRQEGEQQLGITQLPYMVWTDWIRNLNKVSIGVHLMRTHAAGTFALNCAYLGIPCIGYKGLDTQEKCHPNTTIELGDLPAAREIIRKLKEDDAYYNMCSAQALDNYKKYYHEDKFNTTWKEQFKVS
tara:strand:+ start:2577 stop:3512 length:936 start_codon:yes stop_codon:yes gene_type:complete